MARILAISSQVVRGHVGNSATVVALQRLGHEVWPLPTIVLSNHPGHAHVGGTRIAPETMRAMLKALGDNGWLGEVDAVLTGYLPTPEHAEVVAEAIAQVTTARARPLVLVDPVLGDDPRGLYIDVAAAEAVRDRLLPLADIITPNRFELAWLSGRPVANIASAEVAAGSLGGVQVIATSLPAGAPGEIANLMWTRHETMAVSVPRLVKAPHGTGDLLAALFLGCVLNDQPAAEALRSAVAGVRAAIELSAGADELRLIQHSLTS